jgi:D-glycero-D-manno-heptose 1,7-bisphosphate phosphatase
MGIAVFLDRDGTLNVEKGYIREVGAIELIPGAAGAVRRLNDAGIPAIVVTNQTGAARGYYTEEHILALHNKLRELLKKEGGARIDAVYYCPHYESGIVPQYTMACTCRKPAPGMILQAKKEFPHIDLPGSFVVGDKATDIECARNAGCRGILVRTGYGEEVLTGTYQSLSVQPETICVNIAEAVDYILKNRPSL